MRSLVTVAVTENEYRKAQRTFDTASVHGLRCIPCPEGEAELIESVRKHDARHVVLGVRRYCGPLYDALSQGAVVARFGVGYDNLDLPRATERGLLCTNTPGALDDSVAEHAIALILAVARGLRGAIASFDAGRWENSPGSELNGKTLAVVGCGNIGRRTARIAALGLGMTVVGCKRTTADASQLTKMGGFAAVTTDLDVALHQADFVSLHLPANSETRHVIDLNRLYRMQEHAWLINTARGSLVDEQDLFDAIEAGIIQGAALDVFEQEPYVPVCPDKDLRTLSRVLMTPHLGSSTREASSAMAKAALRNISLAEQRQFEHMNLLNPEVITREEQVAQSFA